LGGEGGRGPKFSAEKVDSPFPSLANYIEIFVPPVLGF